MEEQVTMTAQERAEFEAFRAEKAKKEAEAKRKEDMKAYDILVDDTINRAMPVLMDVSCSLADTKKNVIEQFQQALALKSDLYGIKDGQRSHTFTNSEGKARITLGFYCIDDYRDTVKEGIAMVKEAIESLGKDDESRALVSAILRLLSRDQKGTLKASRVLQLQKLAEDSNNERLQEGVRLIRDSYQPAVSKQYIKAEIKDVNNEWITIPLGMTEA